MSGMNAGATDASAGGNASTVDWRVIDDVRPLVGATRRASCNVSADDVDTFQRDGVVYLPQAFAEWVEPLRAGLERNLRRPDQFAFPCESTRSNEPGRFFDSYCNWQLIPEYLSFVLTSAAAATAAALMRSNTAQLFHEHAFCKEVGTTKPTPWHQDLPYYCVDGPQTASVYVALDDIPAEIAVKFVAGSHRADKLYYPRNFAEGRNYVTADPRMSPVPDVDATVDPANIVVRDLRQGDAIVFDFRTLHGSGSAPVAARRRAFSTRWLGDASYFCERRGETSPPLVDLGTAPGERMRDDWFPVLWPNSGAN
jgi:ectoine hydroxylase-related dioxygenase (phytanoyl-CoA dioxygenase family)